MQRFAVPRLTAAVGSAASSIFLSALFFLQHLDVLVGLQRGIVLGHREQPSKRLGELTFFLGGIQRPGGDRTRDRASITCVSVSRSNSMAPRTV